MTRHKLVSQYKNDNISISAHAQQRMRLRGMSDIDIELVVSYGRKIHSRRAVFHVIGHKVIKKVC